MNIIGKQMKLSEAINEARFNDDLSSDQIQYDGKWQVRRET